MNKPAQTRPTDRPALPEAWITPIRLAVYLVVLACSAYIYFNVRDLEWTHWLIFLPIATVAAMVLLDCRMSAAHWAKQRKQSESTQ